MRFSLSTGTLYPYPLRTVFRWARQAGFDGVELSINPEAILRRGEAVQHMAQAEGIEIFSVHPTLLPLPGWRERAGGMGPTIRLVQETSAHWVVMHTPRSPTLDDGGGLEFRQRVETWQPRLEGTGLGLAVENKAVRNSGDHRYALTPLENLRAFADQFDLGLVLDTTHAGSAGANLLHARKVYGPRLVNVHLSDMGGRLPLPRLLPHAQELLAQHRFPGGGTLPLRALVATLSQERYEGLVTLEVNPLDMRAWWPPAVRRRLAEAHIWLEESAQAGSILGR